MIKKVVSQIKYSLSKRKFPKCTFPKKKIEDFALPKLMEEASEKKVGREEIMRALDS